MYSIHTTKLSKFFKLYTDFFNSDIESSILNGRHFIIIDQFMKTLAFIFDKTIDAKDIDRLFEELEITITIERETYHKVTIIEDNEKNNFLNISHNIMTNDICAQLNNFHKAYDFIYCVFSNSDINSSLKDRKFQDLLIEYNNALSHLLIAIKNKATNKKDDTKNIIRAKTHLYRGCLDAYKEVLHKNSSLIQMGNKKSKELNNNTYLEFYLKVRHNEANNIGKNEEDKINILKDYEKLAWCIIN